MYRDPELPVAERVRDLMARMTQEEKVAQLTSVWLTLDPDSGDFAPMQGMMAPTSTPDEQLRHGIGQITRPYGSRPVEPRAGARVLNEFQRRLVEETRLGIPAIAHEESLTGFVTQGATQFPSPLNYGSSWDPELIERVGAVIRRQLRAAGAHQALAPVADVVRDARWGRVEECVGEDPYLVGSIVCAYVRGLQGDDPKTGIAATLKHFAGYSFSEGGRNFAPAHVGPREMADVFLVPFEMAVKEAGVKSVMNAYQDNDGAPCASSHELLTETLRTRWGFEGIVVADYFAVKMLEFIHHVAEGPAEAAAAALEAGLDVELPTPLCFPQGVPEALERGLLSEATLDRAVRRVLRLKFELGLFERPYVDVESLELDTPEESALAREVAEKSITLLQNDGTLPLEAGSARIAVIGPNADDAMALFGNYSFYNHVASLFPDHALPELPPSLLEAICTRAGAERVDFAVGCTILRRDETRWKLDAGSGLPAAVDAANRFSTDTSDIASAAEAARDADVAIVVVGDKAGNFQRGSVGEGTDTDDLSLPGPQPRLVEAVLDTGTPTVVVLVTGRPPALARIAARAAAIVEAWFPGQEGAAALADVLFGAVEPGGRTSLSFSQSAGTQPAYYNHKPVARGVPPHPSFPPVFPFGHGLGYTRFEYADLEVGAAEVPVDGSVRLACTLRNAGQRAGDEVVQLYVRDLVASVTRPVKELRGFRRIHLAPGAAARVSFELPADMLSFTGPDYRRIVEPGEIRVMIGASSDDIRLEGSFRLVGETRVVPEQRALRTPVRVEPLGDVG